MRLYVPRTIFRYEDMIEFSNDLISASTKANSGDLSGLEAVLFDIGIDFNT